MTQEKLKRNQKIYQDKISGKSWTALILKYEISFSALRNIVNREKIKEFNEKLKKIDEL